MSRTTKISKREMLESLSGIVSIAANQILAGKYKKIHIAEWPGVTAILLVEDAPPATIVEALNSIISSTMEEKYE